MIVFLCSERASTSPAPPGRPTAAPCRASSDVRRDVDCRAHARQDRRRRQDLPAVDLRGRPREDARVRARRRRDQPAAPRRRGRAGGRLRRRRRAADVRRRLRGAGGRAGDVRPRGRHRLRAHASTAARSSSGSRSSSPATRSHDRPRVKDIAERRGKGFYVFESVSTNQRRRDRLHRHLDEHRAGGVMAASYEPGGEMPRAEGHAGPLPDRPLRGRVGRLQPDPHRRGVRPAGRAAGADPARAVDDGPGRAGARPTRPAGPRRCRRLSRAVPRHGRARAGDRVTGTVTTVEDGVATVDAEAGRAAGDHPQRRVAEVALD